MGPQCRTCSVRRSSKQIMRAKSGLIDMSVGIRMDQNLDPRKGLEQFVLDLIHHPVRLRYRHSAINPDVELNEIAIAARAGSQIVQAFELWMLSDHRKKALTLLKRPFVIHQLFDGGL